MDSKTVDELLLYCLNMSPDGAGDDRLALLSESDWDAITQRSDWHGVTPLLYQRFRTANTGIPTGGMQHLRDVYLYSKAQNLRLYRKLSKVLGALRDGGIPVIALKGAHLAEIVYENPALRPMSDVDVLVRKADLPVVEEKLVEVGYVPDQDNVRLGEDHYHFIYRLPDKGSKIEVHWHIQIPAWPFRIDVEGLWERAQPATVAGIETLVLSPEDVLLHICLHTSLELFSYFGLRSLCDIVQVIRHYGEQMDWTQVQIRARQWGTVNCAYLTLRLARELLRATVPGEVLHDLESSDFDPRLETWAEARIFAHHLEVIREPQLDNVGRFRASRQPFDRLYVVLRTLFPPPQVLAQKYSLPPGSKRVYLYYPIRVKDLVRRRGRTTLQLLRHEEETIAWAEREAGRTSLLEWLMSG